MSDHHISQENLIAFVVRELSPSEYTRVADHIATCPECRTTVVRLDKLCTLILQDDSQAPSPEVLHRAQAIFAQHASGRATQPGWLKTTWQMLSLRTGRLAIASALAVSFVALALLFKSLPIVSPVIQASLPGDTFYPVKTALEQARIATSPDEASRVQAQLEIAETRVIEINALVEQKRFDLVDETTRDYSLHVQQATASLEQVLKQDPQQIQLAQRAEQDLSQHFDTLVSLQENIPEVSAQIKQAVIASDAAKNTVQNQLATISNPPATQTPPTGAATDTLTVSETSTPAVPDAETPPISAVPPVSVDPVDSVSDTPTLTAPTGAPLPTPTESSIPVTDTVGAPTPVLSPTPAGTPSPPSSAPSITPPATLTETISFTPAPSETPTVPATPSLLNPGMLPTPTQRLPAPAPSPPPATAPLPSSTLPVETTTPSARTTDLATEFAVTVTVAPSRTSTEQPMDATGTTSPGAAEPSLLPLTTTPTPEATPHSVSRPDSTRGEKSKIHAQLVWREHSLDHIEASRARST